MATNTDSTKTPQARPECFDTDRQWEEWNFLRRIAADPRANHCTDCSPCYKKAMGAVGRCQFEGVEFKTVQTRRGTELKGVRPVK